MRLLLDTHVLLWWLANDETLSVPVREAIADTNNVVAVSAVSAWEMSIKQSLGKLEVPADLAEQVERNGFDALSITIADGLAAGRLPRHHDDPFDRILVAQARAHGLTVVTRDRRFPPYGIDVLPA